MRAMVLERQAPCETMPLVMGELPLPRPCKEEVLIKVEACGVCHTDLHILEGDLPAHRLPLVLGHQIVGRVVERGEEVTRVKGGERVGIPWLHWVCGECSMCRRGRENLCERAIFTGYDVDGGYAEYVLAHQGSVYPLPSGYEAPEAAPLLCGGVIGYRAYRACALEKGDTVALFGFGSSAHLVLQVARFEEKKVFVFTRSPEHQELAWKLGASFVGRAEDNPPHPFQAAIVFAPSGSLVRKALEHLAPGGRVVAAGIYATPLPEIPYELLYRERSIQSVANSTRGDVVGLLDTAGKFRFSVHFETYPLERANEVLLKLKRGQIRASAVLIS